MLRRLLILDLFCVSMNSYKICVIYEILAIFLLCVGLGIPLLVKKHVYEVLKVYLVRDQLQTQDLRVNRKPLTFLSFLLSHL